MELKSTARKIFGGISNSYDRVLLYFTFFQDRYWKQYIIRNLGIDDDKLVLDIGCGTCVLEEYLKGPRAHVFGVDLTLPMLEIGLSKNIKCVGGLLLGDAESLPFRSGVFDVVLSCYVAKYCKPTRLVSQVKRVLKPNGKLGMYDFSKPSGLLAPFHALYVYSILEIVGALLHVISPRSSLTFKELPKIIAQSHWESEMNNAVLDMNFRNIKWKKLSGGGVAVIFAELGPMQP